MSGHHRQFVGTFYFENLIFEGIFQSLPVHSSVCFKNDNQHQIDLKSGQKRPKKSGEQSPVKKNSQSVADGVEFTSIWTLIDAKNHQKLHQKKIEAKMLVYSHSIIAFAWKYEIKKC